MLTATSALATSFVVPTDEELVAKSDAIITGAVEGSYVQEVNDRIETVYEIRIDRTIKGGPRAGTLVRIVSEGGAIGDRGVIVSSAARFRQGERVLVFLTLDDDLRWRATDMTLGKFKFATSTAGERMLVRDMEDVVGWDHSGRVHREKVRKENGFLRFVDERVRGRAGVHDYEVEASSVTLQPSEQQFQMSANATAFGAATYTDWVNNQPNRWPNIAAGVPFYKRSDQNISGAADGGVSVIQNGLAAWTNECGSVINLTYAGQVAKASANHDGYNVVEFNDPQSRVSGSWTGSGTIAITFISFAGEHTFQNQAWLNITGADVVFQNGFPATHAAFGTAMTHELGHGIGWRHSNQDYSTGGACNSAVEECTSAAIMNSSVSGSYQYTLQPWDINAAQSVYPGGTCGPICTPPLITGQPQSASITAGTSRTLTVSATGGTPFSFQWYIGTSGNTSTPIGGASGSSLTVTPTTTTSYWVRVSNACGSANSSTATITVTAPPPPPPPPGTKLRTDFNGDGRSELFWRNPATGANMLWIVNGGTVTSTPSLPGVSTAYTPEVFGDFNGDGKSDIMWRDSAGTNYMWLMNGTTPTGVSVTSQPASWNYLASGDFNGDGRFDIFWRNTSTGANVVWFMNGGTVISTLALPATATTWSVGAVGDFNGDGRFDIFWHNASGGNYLWLMSASGPTGVAVISMAANYGVVGTGDFNADGRFDILWRDQATGDNRIWLMNGGSRTEVVLGAVSTARTGDLIGDFNADGHYDIIWRSTNGANAMWLIVNAALNSSATLPALGTEWKLYGMK